MKTIKIITWIGVCILVAFAIGNTTILHQMYKSFDSITIKEVVDTITYYETHDTIYGYLPKPLQQTKDSLQNVKIQVLAETVQYLFEEKNRIDKVNKLVFGQLTILNDLLFEMETPITTYGYAGWQVIEGKRIQNGIEFSCGEKIIGYITGDSIYCSICNKKHLIPTWYNKELK